MARFKLYVPSCELQNETLLLPSVITHRLTKTEISAAKKELKFILTLIDDKQLSIIFDGQEIVRTDTTQQVTHELIREEAMISGFERNTCCIHFWDTKDKKKKSNKVPQDADLQTILAILKQVPIPIIGDAYRQPNGESEYELEIDTPFLNCFKNLDLTILPSHHKATLKKLTQILITKEDELNDLF